MVKANVKSRQFCSVCKQWLDMEVVPTNDGDDDDGVIWFRCPQCQGFLPKLSGADLQVEPEKGADPKPASPPGETQPESDPKESEGAMPWDSPADMMASLAAKETTPTDTTDEPAASEAGEDDPLLGIGEVIPDLDDLDDEVLEVVASLEEGEKKVDPTEEPVLEYAALLAETDASNAIPYRHWGTYEIGQCIHHLAWNDCGVVVAKEELPGGRLVIKVYFEEAGVVRLIEQAPR